MIVKDGQQIQWIRKLLKASNWKNNSNDNYCNTSLIIIKGEMMVKKY